MGIIMFVILVCVIIFLVIFPYPKMKPKREKYDCIIVLGYPANDDGSISYILKSRMDTAIELYKKGQSQKIIVSGSGVANEYTEAEVMKKYAIINGVKSEDIYVENQAIDTYENLIYSKIIMKDHHFDNCLIVTNSWHLRKSSHYAKKEDLNFTMSSAFRPEGYSAVYVCFLHIRYHILTFIWYFEEMFKGNKF